MRSGYHRVTIRRTAVEPLAGRPRALRLHLQGVWQTRGMRAAWFSRDEFEEMIRDGRITDNSTLAAYALLLIRR